MNARTDDLDQTDEDILTYTVSDEELEIAAGTGRKVAGGKVGTVRSWSMVADPCCWSRGVAGVDFSNSYAQQRS
jgi:hypothetical protein